MKKFLISCFAVLGIVGTLTGQTNGLSTQGGQIGLGGDLLNATNINLKGKYLNLNINDASTTPVGAGGLNIISRRNVNTSDNDIYVQQIYTGTTPLGNQGSVAVESFWHSPSAITAGTTANFLSIHKSVLTGTNMGGTTLFGYKSCLYANQPGQIFGNMYHFYVDADISYQPTFKLANHTGLYVSSLKSTATTSTYAIYTAGLADTVFFAGPMRLGRLANNAANDSILITDASGIVKQKYLSGGAYRWSYAGTNLYNLTDKISIGTTNNVLTGNSIFTIESGTSAGINNGLILNSAHGYGTGLGTASSALTFTRNRVTDVSTVTYDAQIVGGNTNETTSQGGYLAFSTSPNATSLTEAMRILPTGNVLINKTSQVNTGYKLDVAGDVRVNKLVVNTTGADFVFEPTYKLLPLNQLEKYVAINRHLPGIATANSMQKDGVDVGENQTKLLQKIEELTLYIIDQNKAIDQLRKEVEELKAVKK